MGSYGVLSRMITLEKIREDELYDQCDTYTGNGTDAFSAPQAFVETVREVVLMAQNYGAIYQLSYDGTNWTDDIYVPADTMLFISFKANSWKVKNWTAGQITAYIVSGFYQTT